MRVFLRWQASIAALVAAAAASAAPAAPAAFADAAAKAIYGVLPREPGRFELAADDAMPVILPSGAATRDDTKEGTLECTPRATWRAAGGGDTAFGLFSASVCGDGARILAESRGIGAAPWLKEAIAQMKDANARRRSGVVFSDDKLPGGAELFFYPLLLKGMDGDRLVWTAALVDKGAARAVVLQVVPDENCDEPRSPYAGYALCDDPQAIMKRLVVAIARTPQAVLPRR